MVTNPSLEHPRLSWRDLVADIVRRGAPAWVVGALLLQLAEIVGRLTGAKILGPDTQGVAEILIAWAATGMLLAGGGFATSAHMHISDTHDPDERQTIVSVAGLGIVASWALLAAGALVLLLTTSWIPAMVAAQAVPLLIIILIGSFGEPRFGLAGLLGTGLKQYALVGRGRCLVGALYFLGWVIGAYVYGVRGALIGWTIALLVGGIYVARRLDLPWAFRLSARQRARRMCRHAWQCLGNQMTSRVTEYLCIFLLMAYLIPLRQIGNFGVALAASKVLLMVPAMLSNLSLPYLVGVHRDRTYHLRLSRMLFWSIVLLTVATWLCLSLAARWLIPAILPRFSQAEPLFQVLAASAAVTAFAQPLGTRFLSLHLPARNLVINILSLATLLAIGAYWVPREGAWGLAAAWCAMNVFRLAVTLALTYLDPSSRCQARWTG